MSFLGLSQIENYSNVPQTLKGTKWTSRFYYYCNYYYFETDSTGFSEDGQVAWSCPIDTLALGISGDKILYSDQREFKYNLSDTILTIKYVSMSPNETKKTRIFYFRFEHNEWISEYEYVYGKEILIKGERIELFE